MKISASRICGAKSPNRSRNRRISTAKSFVPIGFAALTIFSAMIFSGTVAGTLISPIREFLRVWLGVGRYVFTALLAAITFAAFRNGIGKPLQPVKPRVGVAVLALYFAALTSISLIDTRLSGALGTLIHELLRDQFGKTGTMVLLLSWSCAGIGLLLPRKFYQGNWIIRASCPPEKPESDETAPTPEPLIDPKPAVEIPADTNESGKESTVEDEDEMRKYRNKLPPLNLLEPEMGFINREYDLSDTIQAILTAMDELETPVDIVSHCIGPAIIQYQVRPSTKKGANGESSNRQIRVSDVAKVERDLAIQLGVTNLAIQAPVPGENYIGIDLPNPNSMTVRLRPLMESRTFRGIKSPLKVALGRDITGKPVVVDLEKMPHLLIAGTTNSGKSICMRAIALCLLLDNTPDELRIIMIDPKRVELFRFNGVPHLYGEVETEFDRSLAVLNWAVYEMNERYKLFQSEGNGINKIEAHNQYALSRGDKPLPRIVIFIDEVAEIMNGPDKSGSEAINKLAALSRATGIHLVLATQRPDASVITGDIKNNIPARIALNVASGIDSRVIMGRQGAEKLLGRGDMYLIQPSQHTPLRIQGPMLTDSEIDAVVNFWRKLAPPTEDAEEATAPWEAIIAQQEEDELHDKAFKDAVKAVCATGRATTNFLQTKLRISFPRAKRILSRMEDLGIVGPSQAGGKPREVLWSADEADHLEEKLGVTEE